MVRMVFLSVAVLVWLVGATFAQAETFGDWFAGTNGQTTLYAASVNEGGNVFGQFCFLGQDACVWLIGVKAPCQQGDRYPVLANSNVGAMHLEVLCDGQLNSGLYRFAFTNFDQVEKLVKHSARVVFAIPVEENQFGIVRFSLQGAEAALSVLRAAAAEKRTPPAAPEACEEDERT